MVRQKGVFERYLEAMEMTGDIMLRYVFQKEMMKANQLSEAEIDRIAEKVMRRISMCPSSFFCTNSNKY